MCVSRRASHLGSFVNILRRDQIPGNNCTFLWKSPEIQLCSQDGWPTAEGVHTSKWKIGKHVERAKCDKKFLIRCITRKHPWWLQGNKRSCRPSRVCTSGCTPNTSLACHSWTWTWVFLQTTHGSAMGFAKEECAGSTWPQLRQLGPAGPEYSSKNKQVARVHWVVSLTSQGRDARRQGLPQKASDIAHCSWPERPGSLGQTLMSLERFFNPGLKSRLCVLLFCNFG